MYRGRSSLIRHRWWSAAFGLVLMLTATGCERSSSSKDKSESEPDTQPQQQQQKQDEFVAGSEADVFTYALESDPESLDPMKISGVPGGRVAYNLFEGLLMPARTTEGAESPDDLVRPGIAKDWDVSDDGTTYTFHLREDAQWSNGDSVTAQDFIYSWKRTLLPGYPVDYVQLFYVIRGVRDYNNEETESNWEDVGIEAPDEYTLEIELEHPTPYFPQLVAFYTFFPQPKGPVESHGGDWTSPEHIVTNGAYTLASREEGEQLVLEKNPNYWDADSVSVERARIRIISDSETLVEDYRDEKLHWTGRSITPWQVPEFRDHADFRREPTLGTYYVQINVTDEEHFRSEPAFARALRLAIDREALIEEHLNGVFEPADSFVPDEVSGYESDAEIGTDVERAKELIEELDVPSGEALGTIELLYNEGKLQRRVAEALEARWKETLGLDVELVAKPWEKYLESLDITAYEMARSGWVGDYDDPMTFLELWTTDNGNNDTGWSDEAYDELIEKARAAPQSSDRREHFHEAESLLLERGPVIPIFHYVSHELVGSQIEGYEPHNRDIHLLKDLSVE